MCFSATASFTASAILGGIGIASWYLIIKRSIELHNWRIFAQFFCLGLVPIFFAIQQACEGFVWLSLPVANQFAVHGFLLFAYNWSRWIPLSLFILEMRKPVDLPSRINALSIFIILGLLVNWHFSRPLSKEETIPVQVIGHSIYYGINQQDATIRSSWMLAYASCVVFPFFISSLRYAWILGLTGLISGLLAYFIWFATFASVWCFFAAILSVLILVIIKKNLP